MQGNLTLFFTSMVLSDLGEGPLLGYPGSFLRITQLPTVREHSYVVRVLSNGEAVFKYGGSSGDTPSPDPDLLAAQSDYSLDSLNRFLYSIPDSSGVTARTCVLRPELFREVQRVYQASCATDNLEPPEVLQLDGSSIFLELVGPSKGMELSVGHDYPAPFCDLLQLSHMLADAAEEVIPAVFGRLNSPLAALPPDQLDGLLADELPSVISLILAFVPTANLLQYVTRYRATESAGILAASKRIDRRDSHCVSLFYEIERVIARKLQG